MKKIWRSKHHIRYFACAMAIMVGLLPPCAVLAAEEKTSEEDSAGKKESSVIYITAFEPLAEEDAFLSCMEKPSLEELTGLLPETLLVQSEEEKESEELEVVWESEEDYEGTKQERYTFHPKWDETRYMIADSAENTLKIPTITVEVPVDKGMIPELEKAKDALQDIIENKSILALVYLCDKYEVKSEPSSDADTVHTVVSGQSVQITDAALDESGSVWYQTLFYQNGKEYTGYIERGYLAASDEDFTQWEEEYLVIPQAPAPRMMKARRAVVSYPDVEQFPASYQNALYELKANHPNWVFVRMDTGIDWNTAISREMGDKSLVPSSSSGSWQNGVYGQGWSYASEGILKYYMDPRNFLTDPAVFQFEQLTYNASYHTSAAVQEILKNSFMSSGIPGDDRTYAQAFTAIGESTGVSPFHLASRVLQEQGTKGTSALISGSYPGYEGYYNYFNVSASGKTNAEVVQNGLKKAKEQGWNTRYISLNGGACVIGANYILKGQDTLYLEKFNVSNGYHANFTHQYMQNIQAPNSEASNIRKAYNNAGALENSFVFKIPVFQNMPASACTKPNTTDTITLDKTTVDSLQVNNTIKLNPYVNGSKVDYISNLTFSSDNTSVATVDSTGKVTAVSPGKAVISCTRSGAGTAVCTVTVVKADPDVSTPMLSPCIYQEELRLTDITLPNGWTWVNGNIRIEAGTHSYDAIYTPEDTVKYNTVTKKISFAVSKAIPTCKMPEKPKAFVGSTLGEITLPEGFAWESDTKTRLQEPGEYTFYVSYDPNDDNYCQLMHIPFIIQVVGEASKPDEGDGTSSSGSTGTGSGTSSGGSTGTGTGSGTSSDGNTGTGSGTSSSGNTGTENGTSSGGNTGTGSGTSSDGNTGTGSGTSSDGNTGTGSETSSDGSTGTGNGMSSGDSTSTGSGTTSGDSMSAGSDTGSGDSTGNGASSGTGSSDSTSTGTGSGTTSSGSSTNTGGNTTSAAGSSNVGVPLKELSDYTTSTTNNKADSTTGSKPTQESSGGSQPVQETVGSGQPVQNGTDSGQSTQNAADSSQSVQNTAESSQSVQNTADSGQSTQNAADSSQSTQNAAGNSQPTQNATGTKQSSRAERGSANDETKKENAEIPPQTKAAEESQTQTQEPGESFSKPVVTMAMEDTTILTPEMLQMAKEQNLDLLLGMGKYVTWSIDIDSVDMNTVAEVDMGINLGTENIPTEIIAAILDGNKYVEFTLAHNGAFGFNPVLQIALDPMYEGWYANLFYYNEEAASLEFICDAIIGSDGTASFDMEHASSYVVIVSPYSMSGVSASVDTESHVMRWIIAGMIVCMIVIGVGCGIFFYRKKMQDEDEEEEYEEDEEEDCEEAEEEDREEAEEEEEYEEVNAECDETGEKVCEHDDEDDWIEDEDWQEPETPEIVSSDRFADDHAEDDWIDDDEWDIGNDWIEDAEWERKKEA